MTKCYMRLIYNSVLGEMKKRGDQDIKNIRENENNYKKGENKE